MNIFKKITELFSKFNTAVYKFENKYTSLIPSLPAPIKEIEKDKTSFQEELKNGVSQEAPTLTEIEKAVEGYLASYYQLTQQKNPTRILDSYSAVTDIGAHANQLPGNNPENEKYLLDFVEKSNHYQLIAQETSKSAPCFYHILPKKHDSDYIYNKRIYLNLRRENVADFCSNFLFETRNQDIDFDFKFRTDQEIRSCNRSESIVMYLNDKNISPVISTLLTMKEKYPSLIDGANQTNPFLKKIDDFIAYAKEPDTGYYKEKNGDSTPIDKSYNNFLAIGLDESFVDTVNELVEQDNNCKKIFPANSPKVSQQYAHYIPELQQRFGSKLRQGIIERLSAVQERNPCLDIANLPVKQTVLSHDYVPTK